MLCRLSPSSSFHQTHLRAGQWPGLAQEGLSLKQLCEISRTFHPPMSVVLESPTVVLWPISSRLCLAAALPDKHGELAFQAAPLPSLGGRPAKETGTRSL